MFEGGVYGEEGFENEEYDEEYSEEFTEIAKDYEEESGDEAEASDTPEEE